MITTRLDIVRRYLRSQVLTLGAVGAWAHLPGAWPTWPHAGGAAALLAWEGERLPLPELAPRSGARPAILIGLKPGLGGPIDTFAAVAYGASRTVHCALISIGPGGVDTPLNPHEVQVRAFDAGGALIGLAPNAPTLLTARRLPTNKPLITWVYSAFGEQAPPTAFRVFAASGSDAFDWSSPLATTPYSAGQTRYQYVGAALSSGAHRAYAVRAVSAGGVLSLIPRCGLPPAPDYGATAQDRPARLEIPSAPPSDPGTLSLEVSDVV